ncbi:MAG TPA: hypothetical protein VK586_28130 [Streptosporangiaceae bacterium]|nr:hypothetical protein [Streptosporangiaceae bacterium]
MTATTFRRAYGRGHSYTLDGEPKIKGVTTMMKGLGGPPESYFTKFTAGHAVDNWDRLAALPPSARLEEIAGATKTRFSAAAVRGTEVHRLAERLAKGEEVSVPDHVRGHVEAAVQFLDDYDVQTTCTEAALFSRKNKHAGSADAFGTAQKPHAAGRTSILWDWKTNASGPWGSVAFQFAGYSFSDFMLSGDGGKNSEEVPLPPVDECWCVWLRADGYDVYPMHVDESVYRQLLYIDQCRMADADCMNYKGDALPHPESVRKVRLADVQEVTA